MLQISLKIMATVNIRENVKMRCKNKSIAFTYGQEKHGKICNIYIGITGITKTLYKILHINVFVLVYLGYTFLELYLIQVT